MVSRAVEQLAPHLPTARIRPGAGEPTAPSSWTREGLTGRLVQLTGPSSLSAATSLLLDAQLEGETSAWVMRSSRSFFPPDLHAWGVDLDALTVVRVPDGLSVARVGDQLARSGAFGLLLLDIGDNARIPTPLLSRLLGLARKHDTAVLFLTGGVSLGSLISLRIETEMHRLDGGRFAVHLHATKDKRRAPGWTHEEICRGPSGLR